MNWKIVEGPLITGEAGSAWSFEIERGGTRRIVSVESNVSASDQVLVDPEKFACAIETSGRSAVEAILTQDDPPTRLLISVYGLAQYLTTIPSARSLDGRGKSLDH
jgi:hypothetical protein